MKHVSCAVLINEKGEIFLLRRTKDRKHMGGKWHIMSGTIEKDESPKVTLKRELKEELGITDYTITKIGKPVIDNAFEEPYKIYSFLIKTDQKPKVDSREHDKWMWIEIDKIKKHRDIHPSLAFDLMPLDINID